MKATKLKIKPCPCLDASCKQVVIYPLFYHFCQSEASLDREQAEEIVRRYNTHSELLALARLLVDPVEAGSFGPSLNELQHRARAVIAEAEKQP